MKNDLTKRNKLLYTDELFRIDYSYELNDYAVHQWNKEALEWVWLVSSKSEKKIFKELEYYQQRSEK